MASQHTERERGRFDAGVADANEAVAALPVTT
jgi:hypothetical protein